MARQPADIDKKVLEDLIKLHPTAQETADWFDVTIRTIERFIKANYKCSFVAFREKRFAKTRMAIKKKQIEKALTGDNTMLIWVGKQYLGQSDKMEQKNQISVSDSTVDDIQKRFDAAVNEEREYIKPGPSKPIPE